MAASGVARRYGQVGWLVRAGVAAFAAIVVLGAGAAQGASAGAAVTGGHGPVVAGVRQMHADDPGQECFFTFPSCTSADPTVTFVMSSNGDSTGCTFQQDTAWGDGSADTVKTYQGGKPGTALATFTHTYAAPGTYQISYTINVTVNPRNSCTGGSGGLQFMLPTPLVPPCLSSQVTMPAMTAVLPPSGRGVGVTYGPLSLTFTPGVTGTGAQCTMLPAAGVLPIDLSIPGVPGVATKPIGQTDMTATLNLFAANDVASTIPLCDFGPLQALTNPSVTPPLTDFTNTNNCFLTPTYHASWDVVAQWTVPSGVVQMAYSQATNSDTAIYSTQPLTYYVDLGTLPLPLGFSGDTMSALVDFIYSTLAQNLPVLDRIALVQDPAAHLLVTNPFGRQIGIDSKNRTHAFAGAGYSEVGGRSIAWILEPQLGRYHVSVRAKSGSKFSVDMADLQFLGHGTAPLVENFAWNGKLGHTGTATRRFLVHGTALSPALAPHETKTRVKPLTRVYFTLADSVITLGIKKVLWLFGDGTRATGKLAAHRYHKPGRYTPSVTVTDAVGYTVTVNLPVIVVKR
jgi:hypothetical protein